MIEPVCLISELGLLHLVSSNRSGGWDNIVEKRMYITGGIGSSHAGEAFTVDYDLPNLISYTESCAALGLALFANRMLLLEKKEWNSPLSSDIVNRVLW